MIGSWLARTLRARGDVVRIVTRQAPRTDDEIQWEPLRGVSNPRALEGADAVFQLSGAPIADRPWTTQRRKVLYDSRVRATETLLAAFQELDHPPKAFVSTSGLGLFGDRGEELLTDDSPPGHGFFPELCVAWEHANLAAEQLGIRCAVLRMNLVLSPQGGVFPLMVRPFRLLGGWLGDGRQFTPWISIRDAVGALVHLADRQACRGVYNGTVPEPIRNREWLEALGRVMDVPVVTHAPKWALRGALGELADGLLVASVRARPDRLLGAGYTFVDPDAEATFRWLVTEIEGARAAGDAVPGT
jgi:uncharacterized protein (TIGR01777 family)